MAVMNLQKLFENKPDLLLKRERVRSILNDVHQNDMAKTNVMMFAYDLGLVAAIRNGYPLSDLERARFEKLLCQQYALMQDKAKWAVDAWVRAISPAVIRGIKEAEEQEKKEEIKQAQVQEVEEKEETVSIANEIETRVDLEHLCINPQVEIKGDRIFIPCGVGNTDNGFFIYGINKERLCNHPAANVFALVYNYLIRTTRISESDIPQYIRELDLPFELDYRSVFRFAMIILQMIHHNVLTGYNLILNVRKREEQIAVKYAVGLLNFYSALFSRLSRIKALPIQLSFNASGYQLSLDDKTQIYATSNTQFVTNAREVWYGQKINYRLSKENRTDLEYILCEISPFDSFKEGQFDAICSMLSTKSHAVCIMPTGSGKSLIYYFASLLQPLPLFVVAPTEVLIDDQIRNLQKFHKMDNAAHLMLTDHNDFKDFEIYNSINYVTPMTLRNRHLHVKFRYFNNGTKMIGMHEERIAPGPLLSYIILDEIHCISNWGHDFRPEYLMLSNFLRRFMDRVPFWGFTATANYTVVEDVQRQLDIPEENFFSPITFDKYNVTYDYRALDTTDDMFSELVEITGRLISRKQRTLIFTKNDEVSRKVAEIVGYEADVFSSDMPDAYYHFADEKCSVLIASEELGIGINLPNVRNIIHFGLPLSKSEYVQEIGRAGRANEQVVSYILYLKDDATNVPELFLRRDTDMDIIPSIISGIHNDYGDVYRRLTKGCPTKEQLLEQLVELYRIYDKEVQPEAVRSFEYQDLDHNKELLYMLYVTGYIRDWYVYNTSKDVKGVDIMIDITSQGYHDYLNDPSKMFRRMQTKLRDYFEFMGNNREEIAKVNRAQSIEEILKIYVEWYYSKYLYQHNEMFLDVFEMIKGHEHGDSDTITSLIKDYFTLPFMKLKSDELYYGEMSIKEIAAKVSTGFDKSILTNIERINSNRYSYKLDYLLFCGNIRYRSVLEESRLERIFSRAPQSEHKEIIAGIQGIYSVCGIQEKLMILRYFEENSINLNIKVRDFLNTYYLNHEKDLIYYGIMAKEINQYLVNVRRNRHV